MKLLLDTHIWFWSLTDPKKLSRRVTRVLTDSRSELALSPISIWELRMLHRKGRVRFPHSGDAWVAESLTAGPFREAPLTWQVAMAAAEVHLPHNDPADLFLAATARAFDLTLVTADEALLKARGFSVLAND